ncbi:hypothetical protein BFL36_03055 [Clavibacter michiganensis]|uniref:Uncharacterized protein n=1 Tax=Clavibacter michiganensis TaxID=28447 RepID=A0A251YRN7_9MICO|nr:hypothetical protein [Clavibacter michiganensis]OUE26865.1 hypothetical protein BFL36_03055 [Clavibacter michiganensis]
MLRLAPHHLLYRVAADEWRHVTPAREFHRVSGPDALIAEVVARLAGEGVPASGDAGSADDPAAPLVRLLEERGALVPGVPDAAGPLPGTGPVAIHGAGPVADALRALLGGRAIAVGGDIRSGSDLAESCALADACALVSVAPEQPDAAWSRLGRELARTGLPWHRVHQEGELLVVGPLQAASGPGSVTYADYRGRRRAAHRVVEELERLWAEADARLAAGVAPAHAWHGVGTGTAAIAAGIALDELAAHLGGADPGIRHELTIELASGRVERHPVLPLPVDLAEPPAPARASADLAAPAEGAR